MARRRLRASLHSALASGGPARDAGAGFCRGPLDAERENNGLSMVIFESEDAAKQASERIQQNTPAAVTLEDVEIREVAAHA